MKQYFLNIWKAVYSTLLGMRITFACLFEKPCTVQYPDEIHEVPDGYRGILYNEIDDCIGCRACERACPVDCFVIQTDKTDKDLGVTTNGMKKRFDVTIFDIDLSKCMWCNLCTEVCPTQCLAMTPSTKEIWVNRDEMVHHFGTQAER